MEGKKDTLNLPESQVDNNKESAGYLYPDSEEI